MDDDIIAISKIVGDIRPLLAGKSPIVQSASLAHCVAIWLASHHVADDEDATRTMRARLLANFCFFVRELVPINANIIGTMP